MCVHVCVCMCVHVCVCMCVCVCVCMCVCVCVCMCVCVLVCVLCTVCIALYIVITWLWSAQLIQVSSRDCMVLSCDYHPHRSILSWHITTRLDASLRTRSQTGRVCCTTLGRRQTAEWWRLCTHWGRRCVRGHTSCSQT